MHSVITPIIPSNRFASFEKKAYYHRPTKAANENGFDDYLRAAIRVSKPAF